MAEALIVDILGIGVIGPGLNGWPQTCPILRGEAPYVSAPTVIPPPQRLPATERRRAGTIIKVSIVAADEALAMSGLDAANIATVFAASEGDGRNCHELCEALASKDRMVSPTRFTNSVHNAPAGYWHIATHSMAPSTSLCAHDASFAMGLMEAALQVHASQAPVLLVVADAPYPQPLHATRPLPDAMAVALVLGPAGSANAESRSLARMAIEAADAAPRGHHDEAGSTMPSDPALRLLVDQLPVARGLGLLATIATPPSSQASSFDVPGTPSIRVRIEAGRRADARRRRGAALRWPAPCAPRP